MKKKERLRERSLLGVTFTMILMLLLTACGPSGTWDEHYDLGIKYLSDGNYKEAVIEFEAAIKIDDKKPEAYIGAANAYVGIEEYQKAIEVLKSGYEICDDEEIYAMLQKLQFEHGETDMTETFSEWGIDDLMQLDEVTLNHKPIYSMSWDDAEKNVKSIYKARGVEYQIDKNEDGYSGYGYAPGLSIQITTGNGFPGLYVGYHKNSDETYLGWRGIELGESQESVLTKLGFSEDGVAYLAYLLENKKDAEIPLPGEEKSNEGGCIAVHTSDRYMQGNDNLARLDMFYINDSSEKNGHLIQFAFQDGILIDALFTQNNVTVEG